MKKLVSILLTLAVAVSLLVVPAMVSADAPEVTVPFEFSADGRPELKDGSVSLDGENLIVEFTAIGQNAKPDEKNKYTAIYFDANLADKDLSTASENMPWDQNNYVLVYNWWSQPLTEPKSLSWRQSYNDPEDGYTCPYGSPIPNPGMIYSDSVDWPIGLSFTYDLLGDDIKWTATVPMSLLGVGPGDTFGMLVQVRDQNKEYGGNGISINSWPALEYGYNAGYHLGNYALVTIPAPLVKMASFVIDHAKIDFKKKVDDDKVRVQGELELGVASNGVDISDDVTVTVGSFSETITMELKGKKGEKWEYKRPKGGEGDIKKMTINWKNGKFDIRMDKADLVGITNPVTISVQIGDDLGEETITMREKKHHWDYKAK